MNKEFIDKVKTDFPEFKFREGKRFVFRPPKTIILGPPEPFWELLVLHELSHAILEHKTFRTDIERLKMETMAWEKAKELAGTYNVGVDENLIEAELDTYRDWLHQKSRCPICGLTRFQAPDGVYHCPRCENLI